MSAHPAAAPPQSLPAKPTERQICSYIAEMCAELRQLSSAPRFRIVNYLLDMARLESEKMMKELPD